MSLIIKIALAIVVLILIGCGVFYYLFRPTLAVNVDNPPQFIQADFVDLSKVFSVSKFRSGEGHDFSGNGEKCRSMKHYFSGQGDQQKDIQAFIGKQPDPATGTAIYSPVDGQITQMSEEQTPIGKQIYIRPDSAPSYTLRLFHVYPIDGVKNLGKVKAGQLVGYLHEGQGTDIAVQASTLKGFVLFSYFDVMPDSLFAAYKARGIASRDQLIISKAARDAKPLQCNGEEFTTNASQNGQNTEDDVYLTGYKAYQMSMPSQPQTQSQSSPAANYGNDIPQQ